MTGAAFYTYVLKYFKRDDKETESYQAMTDVVRDIRLRIVSNLDKTTNVTATQATNSYSLALPTGYGHLVSDPLVEDTSSSDVYPPLVKMERQAFNEQFPDLTTLAYAGRPQYYTVFGDNIIYAPATDRATYRFRIDYTPYGSTEIVSGTADVPFSERYREIVRYGVLQRLYEGMQNYTDAAQAQQAYEAGLYKIQNDFTMLEGENSPTQYNGI